MLCVDFPVFENRPVWDEREKQKDRKCFGTDLMFFYVLYRAIHFFSNKTIACVKEFDFVWKNIHV